MTEIDRLVLIAEDEPIASMALRAQLEAIGYEVLGPARDGNEAIALGRCFPIDVAVFDHRMPRTTGIEAASTLFRDAPTPVVLLTGFSGADLPDPIPKPPIFALLTKPAGLADIRTALAKAHDAFQAWRDDDSEAGAAADRSLHERRQIARAARARADSTGDSLAEASTDLLRAAQEQRRPLLDVARDLLDGER